MSAPCVVVVGASAGGAVALKALVSALPDDLPAAVCVVLHTAPDFDSRLPEILNSAGRLPAVHARQGEPLRAGRILVAPPDRHLVIRSDHVELSRGPRENHSRPAVDVSLRTASRAFGPRTAGVLLSGMLSDGTMGLMAVKAHGGLAIVQDPEEAAFSSMPEHAVRYVGVDYVLPVLDIAVLVSRRAREMAQVMEESEMQNGDEPVRDSLPRDFVDQIDGRCEEEQSVYTCPDCGGILWQSRRGDVTRFHCYQGHSYAPERLLLDKSEALETALWSAARALVKRATLNRQLAAQLRARGLTDRARNLEEQAELDERHLALLRRDLLQAEGSEAA